MGGQRRRDRLAEGDRTPEWTGQVTPESRSPSCESVSVPTTVLGDLSSREDSEGDWRMEGVTPRGKPVETEDNREIKQENSRNFFSESFRKLPEESARNILAENSELNRKVRIEGLTSHLEALDGRNALSSDHGGPRVEGRGQSLRVEIKLEPGLKPWGKEEVATLLPRREWSPHAK